MEEVSTEPEQRKSINIKHLKFESIMYMRIMYPNISYANSKNSSSKTDIPMKTMYLCPDNVILRIGNKPHHLYIRL